MEKEEKMIAIYHRIMKRENFETAANDIYNLIKHEQEVDPDKPRKLYLDIDGHRNDDGGFDEDMFELVSNFLLGFMGKYLTEISCPIYSVINPDKQVNDIPPKLFIKNKKNLRDDSLDKLFIENYSNTELMSEEEVYKYLEKLSKFLIKFKDLKITESFDKTINNNLLNFWFTYAKDLIIELYNTFVYGNLLTSTAMTRALIECYAYLSIIVKEKDNSLLEDWYLCSIINRFKKMDNKYKKETEKMLKNFCESSKRDYETIKEKFEAGNENKWLELKINKKKITFKDVCEYTKIPNLYDDFKETSSFIHAQDITSKMMPFTFYEPIICKFYKTMFYVFRTIELFPNNNLIIKELEKLEMDLNKLVISYLE